ncbi:MAG: diheme cytochrome c [Oscillatoriaceae bacterium SKW80]|nr:diheme cytochrome c [Oscillatoriaceae bacterium SKYG93]MCX8121193.1 diheme cytochrome c [Oscillatoriaceae bacterium SKW80]MDW8453477.1 diheme cytochrome C [Oscillatoriaceae cyanobacterium SKYGB_i_bin93]HIK26827.1 diheme cytochrome C [Oscillatoriaceae cyanobacterium M7585_C2015_266]
MSQKVKTKIKRQKRLQALLILFGLLLWSLILAWGLTNNERAKALGTVDPVTSSQKLGQELYIENCATCHIALPPAVLPTETWRQLLQDPQHYGIELTMLAEPHRLIVWNYLRTFSRVQRKEEEVPYRVAQSRFFKALHPRVKFSMPVDVKSCVTCHPGAAEYDFRKLIPEWENSP